MIGAHEVHSRVPIGGVLDDDCASIQGEPNARRATGRAMGWLQFKELALTRLPAYRWPASLYTGRRGWLAEHRSDCIEVSP